MRAKLRGPVCLMAAALVAAASFPLAAQDGDGHRDAWQRVGDVAAVLGAAPGAHVADIGAGGGYFTHHLLAAVGPGGRVYAVDISRNAVTRLRALLDRQGTRNVDVILGAADDPRLPFGSLDGALIVNAYHEMTEYRAMLGAIREALRPGGRLVILDNPVGDSSAGRDAQVERHQIHVELVAAEVRDAGFEVVGQDPNFIADTTDGHRHLMWLLTARRPLHDPPVQRFAGAPAGAEGLFACPFPPEPERRADRLSPPDSAELGVSDARCKGCYSRPAARGRVVMGGLVAYGAPWAIGANEATVLRTDRPLSLGTVRLEPGWYSLYAIPEADRWTVAVNRLAARPGLPIDEWVRADDVGRLTVPVERTAEPVERLTLRFEPAPGGAALIIEWERSRVRVELRRDGTG